MKSNEKETLQDRYLFPLSDSSNTSIDSEIKLFGDDIQHTGIESEGYIPSLTFEENSFDLARKPQESENMGVQLQQQSCDQLNVHSEKFTDETTKGTNGDEFGSSSGSNQVGANTEGQTNSKGNPTDMVKERHEISVAKKNKEPALLSESERKSTVLNSSHEDQFEETLRKQEEDDEGGGETQGKKTNGGSHGSKPCLKKPDKILPCPRCESMDTKFCYYNNYNVNQPRHFCKNCQRYWTAGGTLRNVPVGSGRRKNKNANSKSLGGERGNDQSDLRTGNGNGNRHTSGAVDGVESESGVTVVAPSFAPRESVEDVSHGMASSAMVPAHQPSYGGQQMGDVHMAPPWVGGAPPPPHPWGPSPYPPPPYSYFAGGAWAYGYVQPPGSWPAVSPWSGAPPNAVNNTQWGNHWGWNGPPAGMGTTGMPSNKRLREDDCGREGAPWVPKTLRIEEAGEEDKRGSPWTRVGLGGQTVGSSTGVVRPFPSKETPTVAVEALQAYPAAMARSMAFNES